MTADDLIAFEKEVAAAFESGTIRGPIHLSGGNERQLIDIFKNISREDWVSSTYRNHFHALLHGVPRAYVMAEILAGRNMNLFSPEHRFFTSAIVGGTLSIATGVAYGLKGTGRRVWCFVGDMAASTGAYWEASRYAARNALPITFVIEDNGYSANSPTRECWGTSAGGFATRETGYAYERVYPHAGIGKWVNF